MNTLPDEVKEKAKKRFPFEDGAYPSHDACTNARREGFIAGWEEYAKAYAHVPGKENICPVCGGNHSAISPSTASNEELTIEDYKEVFPLSEIDSLKSDVATWKSFCEGYKEKYDEDQKEISNLKREINTLNTDYSEEVKRLNHIIENFGV